MSPDGAVKSQSEHLVELRWTCHGGLLPSRGLGNLLTESTDGKLATWVLPLATC